MAEYHSLIDTYGTGRDKEEGRVFLQGLGLNALRLAVPLSAFRFPPFSFRNVRRNSERLTPSFSFLKK